jgi:uncharacterized protein YdiU (UPF0061 family)
MEATEADFTNTFRTLDDPTGKDADWHARWQARRQREGTPEADSLALMRSVNPDVIPRNHLVEEALAATENDNDLAPLNALLEVLAQPYTPHQKPSKYHEPAEDSACGYKTFCGT